MVERAHELAVAGEQELPIELWLKIHTASVLLPVASTRGRIAAPSGVGRAASWAGRSAAPPSP